MAFGLIQKAKYILAMNSPAFQNRKRSAIEFLIGMQDDNAFQKIESIILELKYQAVQSDSQTPLTIDQLIKRAKLSNEDYSRGNYTTQEEVELASDNW